VADGVGATVAVGTGVGAGVGAVVGAGLGGAGGRPQEIKVIRKMGVVATAPPALRDRARM
jgi:hypothetical protein